MTPNARSRRDELHSLASDVVDREHGGESGRRPHREVEKSAIAAARARVKARLRAAGVL